MNRAQSMEWARRKGPSKVWRTGALVARLIGALVLALVLGCSRQGNEPSGGAPVAGNSIEKRVEAIRAEVERIDAVKDAPESAERRQMTLDLPHWKFFGLFERSNPIFVSALLTQGRLVREEAYYLRSGNLMLARVETWYDVDDPSQAPEPATREDSYIEDDRVLRRVTEVASSPPITRASDISSTAIRWVERSRTIARILVDGAKDNPAIDSLDAVPMVDRAKE